MARYVRDNSVDVDVDVGVGVVANMGMFLVVRYIAEHVTICFFPSSFSSQPESFVIMYILSRHSRSQRKNLI